MTIAPAKDTPSSLSSLAAVAWSDIAMMIGIGLVKDSEAVFFQYLGNEQEPTALTDPYWSSPLTTSA